MTLDALIEELIELQKQGHGQLEVKATYNNNEENPFWIQTVTKTDITAYLKDEEEEIIYLSYK